MLRHFAERTAIAVAVIFGVLNAGVAEARGPRHAAMVMDANTGAILHNEDGDEQRHPASLTKMMTLYLTFETIEQGRLSMSTPVPISDAATNVAPSKLDLDAGDEITVSDAIRALITKSANDVAVALAEKIGGSQANFVRLMNAKAKALGMTKTNFGNASGLPDSDQVTTARDMITLGLRLQDDFSQHYRLFAMREFTYHGHSFRNHNTLMNNFAGIDGIKTGYTQASGFNLVTSVRRNGRHLVAAVFGGRSAAARNGEMRILLTRALNRASTIKSRKPVPALIAKLKGEPKLAERPAKKVKPEADVAVAAPALKPEPKRAASMMLKKAVAAPPVVASLDVAPAPADGPPPAAVASAAAAPVAAVTAALAPQPAPQPAPIAVAKVHRILVAPRQGPKRPAVKPSETTDMASLEEPLPDPSVAETIVPKAFATPAQEPPQHLAAANTAKASMMGAGDVVPAAAPVQAEANVPASPAAQPVVAPVAAAAPMSPDGAPAKITKTALANPANKSAPRPIPVAPKALVTATAKRGMSPSSFEAQAANLHGGVPQTKGRVAALAPQSGAIAGGRFEIQVGAYGSVGEAQKALAAVQAKTGALLASYPSVTQPANKDGRPIFRARFRGFDAATAASACQKLRQQAFNCFVMSVE